MRTFYYKNKMLFKSIFVISSLFIIIVLPIILLISFQKTDPGFNLKDPELEYKDEPTQTNTIEEDGLVTADWYFNFDESKFNRWEATDYYVAISNSSDVGNVDYGKTSDGKTMLWTNHNGESDKIIKKSLAYESFSWKDNAIEDIRNSHDFENDYDSDKPLLKDITNLDSGDGWTIFVKAKFGNKYSSYDKKLDYYLSYDFEEHSQKMIQTKSLTPPEHQVTIKAPKINVNKDKKELNLKFIRSNEYLFSNIYTEMYPALSIEGYKKDMFRFFKNDDETVGIPTIHITFYFQDDNGKILDKTISKETSLSWDETTFLTFHNKGYPGIAIPKEAYDENNNLVYKKLLVSGNVTYQYETKENIKKIADPLNPDEVEIDDPDNVIDGKQHTINFGTKNDPYSLFNEDEEMFKGALGHYKRDNPRFLIYPHWDLNDYFVVSFITKDKYVFANADYSISDARFDQAIKILNKYGDVSLEKDYNILPAFKEYSSQDGERWFYSNSSFFTSLDKNANYFIDQSKSYYRERPSTSSIYDYEHKELDAGFRKNSRKSENYYNQFKISHNFKDFDGEENMVLLPYNIEVLTINHKFETKPFVIVIIVISLLFFVIPISLVLTNKGIKIYKKKKIQHLDE